MATSSDFCDDKAKCMEQSISKIGSNVQVNIALIGQTGSGKSSFINALRGLDNDDKDAAKTGDSTTTCDPTCYPHPTAKNIKFWDQPGHSTSLYPGFKAYKEVVRLNTYNAFLFFTKECLTSTDILLAKQVEKDMKQLFVVRTNLDYDFYNQKRKKTFNKDKMQDEIVKRVLASKNDLRCNRDHVFLISNFEPDKWDFERLTEEIEKLPLEIERKKTEKKKKNEKILIKNFNENTDDNRANEIDKNAIQEKMKKFLMRWKSTNLKLAVLGNLGVGKSSFINAFKNIHSDDKGLAHVGILETTTERKEYPCPSRGKITLVDLPGLGSTKFPDVHTYCKNINIDDCDAFIIMIAGRLTNNDVSWAKKLTSIRKPFLFVRSKIDQDFHNASKKELFNEDAFEVEIRIEIKRNLQHIVMDNIILENILLVNNNDPKQWDFPHLTLAISDLIGLNKSESWNLSLQVLTECILKKKVDVLKGRAWMVALKSIEVEETIHSGSWRRKVEKYSARINGEEIVKHVKFYRSQLGFSENILSEAQSVVVQKFDVPNSMDITIWLKQFHEHGDFDKEGVTCSTKKEAMRKLYNFITNSLQALLDEMERAALTYAQQ